MSIFTIDGENNITAHVGLPAGVDASQLFSSAKELAKLTVEWPASRLVDTWNSFAGVAPFDELKPVKKFTSRKAAVTRRREDRVVQDRHRGADIQDRQVARTQFLQPNAAPGSD